MTDMEKLRNFFNGCGVVLRWIPVTAKMPDKWQKVLVCRKDGEIIIDWITPKLEWNSSQMGDVTHWMPLPEPPKGD